MTGVAETGSGDHNPLADLAPTDKRAAMASIHARFRFATITALGAVLLSASLSVPAERMRTLTVAKAAPGGERRLALVIGNSAYKSSPLRNPVNDAKAMGTALAETGFAVTVIEDGTRATMWRAIRDFGDELARGGVGLFYFAGHGIQLRGRNFLIPVDADVQREDEVEFQAIDANLVLSKMDTAKNLLNIAILDACRNNPFQRSFRSATQGLAQMDAPSGTLISFATAPGSVAADGDGENGLYTKHLLAAIRQPGLPIEQVFKQVRIGVTRDTADQQVPWESSSLKGNFYFVPALVASTAPSAAQLAALQRERDEAVRRAVEEANARAAKERAEADARAAKEREEFQRRMEAMINGALAKQRAELEAARREREGGTPPAAPALTSIASAAPPAPVAAAAPAIAPARAPTVVASIGSSEATKPAPIDRQSGLPQAGDRWAYRLRSRLTGITRQINVEALGATAAGVLERTSLDHGTAQEVVHNAEVQLSGSDPMLLSPYLHAFAELSGQRALDKVGYELVDTCIKGSTRLALPGRCDVRARVIGRESVDTPVGRHDAFRVDLRIYVESRWGNPSADLSYWYAPAIRRLVKASSDGSGASNTVIEGFDLELVAYQIAGQAVIGDAKALDGSSAGRRLAASAPTIAASATQAPPPAAASGPGWPSRGDRWVYEQKSSLTGIGHTVLVEALGATAQGVVERVTVQGRDSREVAHPAQLELSNDPLPVLSPYLLSFLDLARNPGFERTAYGKIFKCTQQSLAGSSGDCVVEARVAANERVATPAGQLEATRVDMILQFNGIWQTPRATLSFWYAPSVKRIVRATGKDPGSGIHSAFEDFEINLLAYQLSGQPIVGNADLLKPGIARR